MFPLGYPSTSATTTTDALKAIQIVYEELISIFYFPIAQPVTLTQAWTVPNPYRCVARLANHLHASSHIPARRTADRTPTLNSTPRTTNPS